MKKKIITSENAPKAIGPYSAGITINNFLFTSGQLGIDPLTGLIVKGGIKAETKQALMNLDAVLKAAGTSLNNVVKTTVFLRNMVEFIEMNEVYAEFFTINYPARSAVQVARLPKDGAVEIEAVAYIE